MFSFVFIRFFRVHLRTALDLFRYNPPMKILLANPRGFCAGVDRAIEIVDRALTLFGAPIYVRHEVVHNTYVVRCLGEKGAVFVEELDEVPNEATVIFSAHGVSQAVRREAEARGLKVFDATCPLVTKVHMEVSRHVRQGYECILIGHAGHPEVEGTLGQYEERQYEAGQYEPGQREQRGGMYLVESTDDVARLQVKDASRLAFVTQTTLSIDDTRTIIKALQQRFPLIIGPKKDDICYATQNRQDAVNKLASECDVMLVVGSANSSNSNRLREIAGKYGIPAYLIDGPDEIDRAWLKDKDCIGITAGASAPELLVQQVVSQLKSWGAVIAEESAGRKEKVAFSLPKELQAVTPAD
ncbi:MAG: 4-hydroxy-3-methylbut-2-enyl diphosphate reductase [Gammaproteobacteria bacterium]|nr:MAG: 4-hydroxy-3-methylbut-2-enyl diphosphate reductase [Gammaproteobacteria bacterium]